MYEVNWVFHRNHLKEITASFINLYVKIHTLVWHIQRGQNLKKGYVSKTATLTLGYFYMILLTYACEKR
jgi:GH35 family endo-1,4-beta-xylanase